MLDKRPAGDYRRNRSGAVRTVVKLPPEEVLAIDRWGVPAGLPSRTAAIRILLKRGLEAVREDGGPTVEARVESWPPTIG